MSYQINKCNICLSKNICKHYQYFRDNFDLVIEVKDCSNFRSDSNITINQSESIIPKWGNTNNIDNNTMLLKKEPKIYPDLKELDKLMPITQPNSEPLKITPVTIAKAECDRCKQQVPSIDIDNCVECGRPVCKDCGVTTINTAGIPECTCEKCWSGAPDPDPNSSEEVSITYGEEEKEWNLEDFEEVDIEKTKTTNKQKQNIEEELDNESRREQVADKPSNRKSKKK